MKKKFALVVAMSLVVAIALIGLTSCFGGGLGGDGNKTTEETDNSVFDFMEAINKAEAFTIHFEEATGISDMVYSNGNMSIVQKTKSGELLQELYLIKKGNSIIASGFTENKWQGNKISATNSIYVNYLNQMKSQIAKLTAQYKKENMVKKDGYWYPKKSDGSPDKSYACKVEDGVFKEYRGNNATLTLESEVKIGGEVVLPKKHKSLSDLIDIHSDYFTSQQVSIIVPLTSGAGTMELVVDAQGNKASCIIKDSEGIKTAEYYYTNILSTSPYSYQCRYNEGNGWEKVTGETAYYSYIAFFGTLNTVLDDLQYVTSYSMDGDSWYAANSSGAFNRNMLIKPVNGTLEVSKKENEEWVKKYTLIPSGKVVIPEEAMNAA